jgi:hypothetical protein
MQIHDHDTIMVFSKVFDGFLSVAGLVKRGLRQVVSENHTEKIPNAGLVIYNENPML